MQEGGDVVRFQNVGMRYELGREILHDVSLRLEAGSFQAGCKCLPAFEATACQFGNGVDRVVRDQVDVNGNALEELLETVDVCVTVVNHLKIPSRWTDWKIEQSS